MEGEGGEMGGERCVDGCGYCVEMWSDVVGVGMGMGSSRRVNLEEWEVRMR